MVERKMDSMIERALKAKKLAIADPSLMDIDDDHVPWVYDEETGLWYSFEGRYSSYSPEQKREHNQRQEAVQIEFEKRAAERALEKYEDNLYWSKIRRDILARDKNTCQVCGKKGPSTWHIHHIMRRSEGGTDHYDNLVVVCPKCHNKAEYKMYDPEWIE